MKEKKNNSSKQGEKPYQLVNFVRDGRYMEAHWKKPICLEENSPLRCHEEDDMHPLSFLWNNYLIGCLLKKWREKRDAAGKYLEIKPPSGTYFEGREIFFKKSISKYQAIEKKIEENNLSAARDLIEELLVHFHENNTYFKEYANSHVNGTKASVIISRVKKLHVFILQEINQEIVNESNRLTAFKKPDFVIN